MTQKERDKPSIINGSRKQRISKGSGSRVSDINRLLKQFVQMNKMMKKFSTMGSDKKSMRALQNMMGQGGGQGMF
jgi:signal recognition particle subunit SRP54